MPRASHRVAIDHAFSERSTVVRAACPDGEILVADSRQHDRFAARMTEDLVPGLQRTGFDPNGQVGSSELGLSAHRCASKFQYGTPTQYAPSRSRSRALRGRNKFGCTIKWRPFNLAPFSPPRDERS